MNTKQTNENQQPAPTGSAADFAKRIPFRMVSHMSCENEHVLEYLNDPLNIACVIVTPYRFGNPGKANRTYGINERKSKGYARLSDLLEANPQVMWKVQLLYPPNQVAANTSTTL